MGQYIRFRATISEKSVS